MEAALKNWSVMHQHHDGQWINEAAEQTGNKMLAELNQTKEKLAEVLGAASLDEIEVPVSMQLDILANGVGVAKGRGIRGLGYGPRKEPVLYSESDKSTNASVTEQKVVELTATVEKLLRHINHIEEQLAVVKGYIIHHSSDEDDYDNGDDDVNIYGDEDEGVD